MDNQGFREIAVNESALAAHISSTPRAAILACRLRYFQNSECRERQHYEFIATLRESADELERLTGTKWTPKWT